MDTRILLERSIFEYIRKAVVDAGYTPDIIGYENTQSEYARYKSDLQAINSSKGFSIEIFNNSTGVDKGLRQIPRIVLTYTVFSPGNWGSAPGTYIGLNSENKHQAFKDDILSVELFVTCLIISRTTSQERFMSSLLSYILPPFVFIPYYSDLTQKFLVEFVSTSDISDRDGQVFEKSVYYKVPDILLNEGEEVGEEIPSITDITINQYISNYLGLTLNINNND
jgi:hypothetical protein